MNYFPTWHPKHQPMAPIVQTRTDDRDYINLGEINAARREEILNWLKQNRPQWFKVITTDPFIAALQKQFNAAITLKRRARG